MLYWFPVKGLGPTAYHRLSPAVSRLGNVPREDGAIIAANHLAVIDGTLISITYPCMVHFMGKAGYFEDRGLRGKFKKWWFTPVRVFPVGHSGDSKSLGALEHACEIIEDGHLFGVHTEGTHDPDGRPYRGHIGATRLALETGCPIVPTAIIGSDKLQPIGTSTPKRGKTKVLYSKPTEVAKEPADEIIHDDLHSLTNRVSTAIQKMSGREFVSEYAQKVKAELKAQQAAEETER